LLDCWGQRVTPGGTRTVRYSAALLGEMTLRGREFEAYKGRQVAPSTLGVSDRWLFITCRVLPRRGFSRWRIGQGPGVPDDAGTLNRAPITPGGRPYVTSRPAHPHLIPGETPSADDGGAKSRRGTHRRVLLRFVPDSGSQCHRRGGRGKTGAATPASLHTCPNIIKTWALVSSIH